MVKNVLAEKIKSGEMELKDVGDSDSGIDDGDEIDDSLSFEEQVSARVQTMSAAEKNKYVKDFLQKGQERAAVREHLAKLAKEKGTDVDFTRDDVDKALDAIPEKDLKVIVKEFCAANLKKNMERAAVREHLEEDKETDDDVTRDDVDKALDAIPENDLKVIVKKFYAAKREKAAVREHLELEELRKSMLSEG